MTILMMVLLALLCVCLFMSILFSIRAQIKKDKDLWKKGGYLAGACYVIMLIVVIAVFVYICI